MGSKMSPDRKLQSPNEDVLLLVWDLVNHLDAMVAYWDKDQTCVFANEAYLHWFGIDGREIVGSTMQELLGPLYQKNLPFIKAAYEGKKQVFERAIPQPQGETRHSLATYLPNFVDGVVQGIFVHVVDVGPLKQLEDELKAAMGRAERLATHDFLTGLPNRVMLDAKVETAIAEASRTSGGFALMCLDVDRFKAINDTYGHIEGDRFLAEVALRIKNAIRDRDVVFRFGGDEFVLLANHVTSAEDITGLAARLQFEVGRPFRIGGATVFPKVSVGAAIYPRNGRTTNALMQASDAALYAAKEAGRNCVVLAEGWSGTEGGPHVTPEPPSPAIGSPCA